MNRFERAPVDASDQLWRMTTTINDCARAATDFLRMGQGGQGIPRHFMHPRQVTRSGPGGDYQVPVLDPLIESVYRIGYLSGGSDQRREGLGFDVAYANEIFAAANRRLMDVFESVAFNAAIDAQSSDVAARIRQVGSDFVWHWCDELLCLTDDPELIKEFAGSTLFRRLYSGADKVGDPLLTRLTAHVVRLEGSGINSRLTYSYKTLMQHAAAQLAQGMDARDALRLITQHTPGAVPGLLSQSKDVEFYRSEVIDETLRCIRQRVTGDHLALLKELGAPLYDSLEGCARLVDAYHDNGVVPPAVLLHRMAGHLAHHPAHVGDQEASSFESRQRLTKMLVRYISVIK